MRALFILFLILLFSFTQAIYAKKSIKPIVLKSFAPEKVRDDVLEKAIIMHMEVEEACDDSWKEYSYNRVDLNGDGNSEVLVFLMGSYFCGSWGCMISIYQHKKGEYIYVGGNVGTLPVCNEAHEVIVSKHKTKGWNDLIYQSCSREADYPLIVLKFDGKSYSYGTELKSKVKGNAYLVGDKTFGLCGKKSE